MSELRSLKVKDDTYAMVTKLVGDLQLNCFYFISCGDLQDAYANVPF